MPLVNWLENRLPPKNRSVKAKRVISIVIIFVLLIIVVSLFVAYIGSVVISASEKLMDKVPFIMTRSLEQFNDWIKEIKTGMPEVWMSQMDSVMQNMGLQTSKFVQDSAIGAAALIPSSIPTAMSFAILPFFLFFLLMDYEAFRKFFYDYMPAKAAKQAADILTILGEVMGRYIRSTLILSLIVGVMVWLGLWALGVEYSPALGAVTAVAQFIPIVGPFVSGLIVMIITLALQPDKLLWALLVFVLAQIILNSIFVNWIQGRYLQIHPAVIMVILMVGGFTGGFWGMVLVLPVAATIWEIFKYYRAQRVDQEIQS
jgi:predicted PurR-regulated permease PerM